MQTVYAFTIGILVGLFTSYILVNAANYDQSVTADFKNAHENITPTENSSTKSFSASHVAIRPSQKNHVSVMGEYQLPKVDRQQVNQLITNFQKYSDDLYSSDEFKDLTYLVRHNQSIAQLVKDRITASESYDERLSLVAVIAHNTSRDTLDFAASLIQSMDEETQGLGFDLLMAMGDDSGTTELNTVLLDATVYETNPQSLSNIITHLSSAMLDAPTKAKVIESVQELLYRDENTMVTARAIDGLRQLGNQDALFAAVLDHLGHPSAEVKTAAISAMNFLDKNKIDRQMIEMVRSIADNPQESTLTREYANSFLDSL